ncbi:MAG: DUF4397 domain-containing protein [bacterium]|nr:DUF4397 domain-containing protein [bacterium]
MLKKLSLMMAVLLLVGAMGASAQAAGNAAVRYVHALAGAPAVDVYTDGTLVYGGLAFGEATPYLAIAPGTHEINVTAAGAPNALWTQTLDIAADQAVIGIVSSDESLQFTFFQDDLNPLPLGRARLTAIHAIPDAPAVDVVLADGRPVIPNLQYDQPYGTLDIPSQAYNLVVIPAGGVIDDAVLPETAFALSTGTSYIVVAYGTAAEPNVLVLSAPTLAGDTAAGYVRVVHAVEGGPAVDVSANGALVIPALAFGTATEYIALPAGDYEFSVTAQGEDAALVTASVPVAANTRSTIVASAAANGVVLSGFTSEPAVITAGEAAFTLANVAPEAAASAALTGGESIVTSLAANDFGTSSLAPARTDILVAAGESTTEFGATGIYGGIFYDAIVYAGENGDQVLTLPLVSLPLTTAADATVQAQGSPTTDPNIAFATATAAEVVQAEPVQPQAQATAAPPQAVTPSDGPTARVLLDPGANLHLRLYPSAEAFSLGLAPSGTVFRILGREGAPEDATFFTPTPTPQGAPTPTPFIDPATLLGEDDDLVPFETWLFVEYDTPDGGLITAWVNAQFLEVRDEDDVLLKLRELPTIPRNRAGELGGTPAGVAPTANPLRNVNIATVTGLQPGANLHIRRRDNAQSESLSLLPNGTTLLVQGRNAAGDWLQVDYQGQIGWVAVPYVRVTYNDRTVDVITLEIVGDASANGTVTGGEVVGIGGVPTDSPNDESGD